MAMPNDARVILKRMAKAIAQHESECESRPGRLLMPPCAEHCHCLMVASSVCEAIYSLADDWGGRGWARMAEAMSEAGEDGGVGGLP